MANKNVTQLTTTTSTLGCYLEITVPNGSGSYVSRRISFNNFLNAINKDPSNKGYFDTEALLIAAVPSGQAGWYAIVGDTDTLWTWDLGTSEWIDTGKSGLVTSVNGLTGEVIIEGSDIAYDGTELTSANISDALDELAVMVALSGANGLTKVGTNLEIGGTLTKDTVLALTNGFTFAINGSNTENGIAGGHIELKGKSATNEYWTRLTTKAADGTVRGLDITDLIMTVYGPSTFKGLVYGNDYSANFDEFSIPHLGFIQSLISASNYRKKMNEVCDGTVDQIIAYSSAHVNIRPVIYDYEGRGIEVTAFDASGFTITSLESGYFGYETKADI